MPSGPGEPREQGRDAGTPHAYPGGPTRPTPYESDTTPPPATRRNRLLFGVVAAFGLLALCIVIMALFWA